MSEVEIKIPPKLVPVFSGDADYRGAYGGRGSAKTYTFCTMLAVKGYMYGMNGITGQILVCREYLKDVRESCIQEIKRAIAAYPFLSAYYDCGDNYVKSKDGRIEFIFSGLTDRMLNSLKGKANILVAFLEEAEETSRMAYTKLIPTLRSEGKFPDGTPWHSELWMCWNPETEGNATDELFRKSPPDRSKIVEVNYQDNPWFPNQLERARLNDLKNKPYSEYAWIWEGAYLENSDKQVLSGKVACEEFEADELRWDGPYYGIDFGFSQDPSAAVRCWIHDGMLWVDYNWARQGVETDDLAGYLIANIPGIESSVSRADSARPETISYLQRHGISQCRSVVKHKIEDGIAFLRSFEKIVIHPRCKPILEESRKYSYKVNRAGDITTQIVDKDNHSIDALRYAIAPLVKGNGGATALMMRRR